MAEVFTDRYQEVMVITMARREANNALNEAFMAKITAAFDQAEADPRVKAVVLTGSGRVFCMGADIEEMLPLTGAEALRWGRLGTDLNLKIERFSTPVAAAMNWPWPVMEGSHPGEPVSDSRNVRWALPPVRGRRCVCRGW